MIIRDIIAIRTISLLQLGRKYKHYVHRKKGAKPTTKIKLVPEQNLSKTQNIYSSKILGYTYRVCKITVEIMLHVLF